jgi:hypothetical protein
MPRKSIHVLYCDDIRTEIGGKHSFMGVYNSEMVFPDFPASLPKLHAHITVTVPYEESPKHRVEIRLLHGDLVLAEAILDQATLALYPVPLPDMESAPEERNLALTLDFILSPFQVPEPTRILLRAMVDGEELKGNALKIRAATPEEQRSIKIAP